MANIAVVLKEEIARLARKEVRSETEKLKKASVQYRADIAALKRRIATLEQRTSLIEKKGRGVTAPTPIEPTGGRRIAANGIRALRLRLGLSAADLGFMIGVSAQSVYSWEAGNSRPREQPLAALVTLKGMAKRDVAVLLDQLKGQRP